MGRVGRALRGATCGGEHAGDNRFEVGGKFAKRKIVATYKAGAYINTKVRIDINHWGARLPTCMAQHCTVDGSTAGRQAARA